MPRVPESTRLTMAAGLLAFVGAGCFGSQYRSEGRHGSAAAVAVQDCVGLALIGGSAVLLYEASRHEEPNLAQLFQLMGAGAAGAGAYGLIWLAETRYSRGKHGDGPERGVERLRLSDPPRLKKLMWMKFGGICLAAGGMAMGQAYRPLSPEDDQTLSLVGGGLGLTGTFMALYAQHSLMKEGRRSHDGVAFGPGSIAFVCRF